MRNLTGKRFGRLIVLNKTNQKDSSRRYYWRCVCDCGEKTLATSYGLKSGHKRSCGCLRKDMYEDLTGREFGRLTVVRYTGKNNGSNPPRRMWLCKCDCGNMIEVDTHNLKGGNTRSCGCLAAESKKESITVNSNINWGVDSIEFKKMKEKATKKYVKKFVKEGTNLKNLDSKIGKNNTSGVKGVTWDKARSKWKAFIGFKGKTIQLGRFADKQDAINARKEAEEKYFEPILEKYGKIQVEQ